MKADNSMLKHGCRIESCGRSQTQQPLAPNIQIIWLLYPGTCLLLHLKLTRFFSHWSPSCSPRGKVSSPANCFLPCVNLDVSFSVPYSAAPETSLEVKMVQEQITPSMVPSPGDQKVKPVSERCRGIFTVDENSYILIHK